MACPHQRVVDEVLVRPVIDLFETIIAQLNAQNTQIGIDGCLLRMNAE